MCVGVRGVGWGWDEEKYFTSGELLSGLIYFSSLSPVTFQAPSDERIFSLFEKSSHSPKFIKANGTLIEIKGDLRSGLSKTGYRPLFRLYSLLFSQPLNFKQEGRENISLQESHSVPGIKHREGKMRYQINIQAITPVLQPLLLLF